MGWIKGNHNFWLAIYDFGMNGNNFEKMVSDDDKPKNNEFQPSEEEKVRIYDFQFLDQNFRI